MNGSGGTGKDTFVDYVEKFINTYHYSSITKIKEIASLMGWDGGKDEIDRKFLSDLKLLSSSYNNLPFKEIEKTVHRFKMCNEKDSLLFIDIREPDEIKKAVKLFDAITMLIINKNINHITSNMADKNVFNYKYDFIIKNNNDKNELRKQAEQLVSMYKNGTLFKRSCPYLICDTKETELGCLKCKYSYDDDSSLYCILMEK